MGVLRSWHCLNANCDRVFDAWEPHPSCPGCGNVRVQWVPGGGHVAGTAKAADAELRALADNFGLSDLNSARRDERAKPKLPAQPTLDRYAQPIQFAPGFSAPVAPNGQAMCVPSTTGVSNKVKAGVGNALPKSRSVPGVHSNTRVEARHNG